MKSILGKIILNYLRFFARVKIKRENPYIVGITGSSGKTSTRKAVTTVLKQKFCVKETTHGNSESGIPLDILDISLKNYLLLSWIFACLLTPVKAFISSKEKYEIYVIEMGIDSPFEPKNMSYLLSIVQPNTGIFINTNLVHSMQFDPLAKEQDPEKRKKEIINLIALEKGKLISSLPKNGYAIVNADDKQVLKSIEKTKAKTILVGRDNNNDIQIKDIKISIHGFSCSYYLKELKESITVTVPGQLLSEKYSTTFGLAIATGLTQKLSINKIISALNMFTPEPGRMSIFDGVNGSKIIDSSYNASLETMLEALNVLEMVSYGKKKIVLLGEMRELGEESEQEHITLAEKTVKIANEIHIVGECMEKHFYPAAIRIGYDKSKIFIHKNAREAGVSILKNITKDDIVLVKGSQNKLFLEEAVEILMKNKADTKRLCRRGDYWDKQRENNYKLSQL